jgi:hypothetical protein
MTKKAKPNNVSDYPEPLSEASLMIQDLCMEGVELLLEENAKTWRSMGVQGSPDELLEAAGESRAYDEGFFRGGNVAIEAALIEMRAKRLSLFLG